MGNWCRYIFYIKCKQSIHASHGHPYMTVYTVIRKS